MTPAVRRVSFALLAATSTVALLTGCGGQQELLRHR